MRERVERQNGIQRELAENVTECGWERDQGTTMTGNGTAREQD